MERSRNQFVPNIIQSDSEESVCLEKVLNYLLTPGSLALHYKSARSCPAGFSLQSSLLNKGLLLFILSEFEDYLL